MMIVRPLIVWLMMEVRLSGHPLIRDSLKDTKSRPRDRLEPAFDGGGVATGAVGLPTSVFMGIPE